MAAVKQENFVNNDVDHLFQTIENLQIALKASSDAYQFAQEQAKKDQVKFQDEVERICEVSNFKRFKLLEKIKYYEDQLASHLSPSKPFQVAHQAQQTLQEDDLVDQEQLTTSEAEFIDKEIQTYPQPQPVKKIDTASSQTDEDQVLLSNMNKILNLEMSMSKMEHNQELLISELNHKKKENIALLEEITMRKKKMAEVVFANNLYHVSLIEQNCSLPDDAEEILSSLSNGGQAEDPHPSFIIQSSKEQEATSTFQKVQVDTKNIKKEQSTNEFPEGHNITTMFPLKEESTMPTRKEYNKATTRNNLVKELSWISKMSQVLTKLENKFAIPVEKRKPRMFKRKLQINHIIPKPFRTIFHLLAAPEPVVTVPEPYPVVDWANVRLKAALPNPASFPVRSASKDPKVYQMEKGFYSTTYSSKFTSSGHPFGTLPGYKTTEGVVQVPRNPVHGYIYCPEAHQWLLHASPNPVRRSTAGRGGPGTSRGEERRGKKPHSLP